MSFDLVGNASGFSPFEANPVRFDMDAGADTLFVSGNSRVGIGTSSPATKLHVNGNISMASSSNINNNNGERVEFDNGDNTVEIRADNQGRFVVGAGGVSGSYGTVQTKNGGKGGWEGYSINGRYVFMSDDNTMGLYNDVNNRWITLFERNNYYRIYEPDSGSVRFQVHANGQWV